MNEEQLLSMDRELTALEEENGALRLELARLHAFNEIQRLMGKFFLNHSRHDHPDYLSVKDLAMFFARREDSSFELANNGVYVGWESIDAMFRTILDRGPKKDVMYTFYLASPEIEVAGDGQTAIGVWNVMGNLADPRLAENGREDGSPVAYWIWGRVRASFLLQDGVWRIWHYHFYRQFTAPYYNSWADFDGTNPFEDGILQHPAFRNADLPRPQRPTTWDNPYDREGEQFPIPPAPEPYGTWRPELAQV